MFLGITFDKLLIDVATDKRKGLLLKVARCYDSLGLHLGYCLPALLVKSTLRLCGSRHSPHLVERIHVERQVVQPSVGSLRHRRVGVTVKWHYRVDEIPHLAVGRVEDMCAILMHVNSLYLLAIEISPNACR